MAGNLDETADAITAQPEPRTSGLAITALILGILGCLPLAGIAAVVLGAIALSKIGKSGGQLTGRGLAIGGIAAGAVTTVMTLAFVGLMLPAVGAARGNARRVSCSNNLRQIGMALSCYAGDYDEAFPPSLDLLYPDYIDNPGVFECPAKRGGPGYVYVAGLRDGLSPACVLAYEHPGNHKGGGNVLFIGARVQWMSEPELQQALAETREAAKKSACQIRLVGE